MSKIKLNDFCHKTLKWQLVLGSYWDFCEHLGKVLGFLACLSARYDLGCLAIDGNPLPSDITKPISLVNVQEALEVYRKLPEPQFNTGWVLCQVQSMQDNWKLPELFMTLFIEYIWSPS